MPFIKLLLIERHINNYECETLLGTARDSATIYRLKNSTVWFLVIIPFRGLFGYSNVERSVAYMNLKMQEKGTDAGGVPSVSFAYMCCGVLLFAGLGRVQSTKSRSFNGTVFMRYVCMCMVEGHGLV